MDQNLRQYSIHPQASRAKESGQNPACFRGMFCMVSGKLLKDCRDLHLDFNMELRRGREAKQEERRAPRFTLPPPPTPPHPPHHHHHRRHHAYIADCKAPASPRRSAPGSPRRSQRALDPLEPKSPGGGSGERSQQPWSATGAGSGDTKGVLADGEAMAVDGGEAGPAESKRSSGHGRDDDGGESDGKVPASTAPAIDPTFLFFTRYTTYERTLRLRGAACPEL